MDARYIIYFLLGGSLICVVTYFASQAKGLPAAFFANLPVITLITFLTVYHESGRKEVITYAKGLIIMLPPWLAYIFAIIFLTHRFGFIPSLIIGISLYFILAYLIISIKRF